MTPSFESYCKSLTGKPQEENPNSYFLLSFSVHLLNKAQHGALQLSGPSRSDKQLPAAQP